MALRVLPTPTPSLPLEGEGADRVRFNIDTYAFLPGAAVLRRIAE